MFLSNYFYLIIIICLNSVIWFQVFLSNTNNFQKINLIYKWGSYRYRQIWLDMGVIETKEYFTLLSEV